MSGFWIVWTLVMMGITAWDVDLYLHNGLSPVWIGVAASGVVFSILNIFLYWN